MMQELDFWSWVLDFDLGLDFLIKSIARGVYGRVF